MAPVACRELQAKERELLAAHLLALGPEDRRLRFGTQLSDEGVRGYTAGLDFERDALFGVFDQDLRLIGAAHLARREEFAEFGVSVLPAHRGRGVGEALLARAHLQARNWGVETLLMHCLAENAAMRHLATKLGMRLAAEKSELAASVEVPPASPASAVTQMLAENIGLFDYALKAQLLAARNAMGLGMDRIRRKEGTSMEKIWLQSYPPGMTAEISYDEYKSIGELFEKNCRIFADRPAFTCMGKTLSFAEVDRRSRDFAAWLQAKGLPKGTRIALMMPNVLQYPVALFGTLRAGYTVVNLNPLYTARELEHQLKDSGAQVIVILENFAVTLQEVLAKTPLKHVVVTALGDMLGLKGLLVNFVLRHVRKMVPAFSLPGALSLSGVLSEGAGKPMQPFEVGHEDIAFLQYTGGTTGVSKGAMLLHRNILANIEQASGNLSSALGGERPVIITALPLYHIFSLTVNCLLMAKMGGENVLITNPRDIPGFVKELGKHRYNMITGVNTLFNAFVNNPEFVKLDFSYLKLCVGGGMAVQKAVADKWQQVTGRVLLEGYGLTETSPCATMSPHNMKAYSGSIGIPLPSTDIALRDDDRKDVALGQPGEICIKGPQVMKGYWQRPEETAQVIGPDGYLYTGDVGVMDERGFIRIVDRKKDMILVSGFNVYPNEIEQVVAMMPGVLEVAAIGVPDEKSGEVPKLFIVKKEPSLTEAQVLAHCKEQLTGYKQPRYVEFRADLPKTNVGKILRRALRDEELKKKK